MKYIKSITFTIAIMAFTVAGAQSFSNLPKRYVGDEVFYCYTIGSNESLFTVAQKLGVRTEEILRYNPWAQQGVERKNILFLKEAEADMPVVVSPETTDVMTIVTDEGDNIYSLAKRYDTTVERLIALNPGLAESAIKTGDKVKIQASTPEVITLARDLTQFFPYTIKNGDTFFEIAKEQGVESSLIKAANDNPTKLKKGHILYIPRRGKELTHVLSSNATIDELRDYYGNKLNTIYTAQHCPNLNDDKVNIGIILPFQLHKEDPPRQALLYTDFYKGFLLAVDSIGKKSKKPVNINVWDTQHNLNVTDSLLALDEMKNLDVLFAPGEPKQLQRVNKFGENNHIDVINCFTGKNNDYETNPYVFQVNTPNSMLSSIVSDWVGKKFNEYTIVYLDDPDLRDTDFYPAFKEQIEALGMKHKTLTIIHDLEYEKLSKYMDPGMNYLFVPTTSSKTMMAKTIKAIKTAKNERFDCEIALLGYPEYLLMTKDYGESFSAIDTYIFSKFYNNDAKRTRNIETLFVKQYGETMINTMPSMALLGFDMGMYVINALSNGQSLGKANSVHDGIQTSLNFERVNNWGGFINRFVKIVHMTPSGIKVSTLK